MNDNPDFSFDLFEFQGFLGQGSFGTVLKALNKETQQLVAVKKKSLLQLEQLLQEAHILQELQHPNIVKFFGVHETESRILIEMELIQGGSLSSIPKCSEEQIKYIMYQIFNALQYMHNNNIAHRDLKPENILVTHDLSLVKVTDFGLSTGYASLMTKQCGTLIYMAPEQLNNKIYNKAIDIWAAGVIMYQLIVGQHPYYKKGCDVSQSQLQMHEQCKTYLNDIQYSLFRRLTEINPTKRYSATQALLHPWFNCGNDEPLTMEEQFQKWKQSQKLHKFILTLMLLNKMGYKKQLNDKEFYNEMSKKINQIKKQEFLLGNYDQLFADYQKSLTEDQKSKISCVSNKMDQNTRIDLHTTIDSTKQSHSTILQSSKLLLPFTSKQPIRVVNLNLQNQTPTVIEDIEQEQMMKLSVHRNKEKQEKPIIRQQLIIQSTKLNQTTEDNQQLIQDIKISHQQNSEKQLEQSTTPSPTKSPQTLKKRRVKKQQLKQYLNEDIIQTNYQQMHNVIQVSQQEYNNNNIRQQSPLTKNAFKIQLKPLNHLPSMASSQHNNPNPSLRPRNQKHSVDREFYAPPILDLSNLALECMSPKQRQTRAISLSSQRRVYANEFQPYRVLGVIGRNNQDSFNIK
ncbi:unnamed protein product (macronuclear) [Paramecium tetraurelia]|uniref:non-specific serine/threonine protein kinase n=1 Tax=Paramecium tetraurelia TaxID=5888 RepID=A0BSS3_PARTE|nr:uncharacterized protein GSPATT00031822001 [Paramecium tetraurelia]CAK61590.1 unnamed protein product [Paramecium tetraurelia]|eukprot:XP_001428988.1 hypothetical protein (macronuclear) [Paramecium tetraurelia strain d4-2]